MAIAELRHPSRSRQMRVVDNLRSLRFTIRIEAKNDRDCLAPVRAFRVGVEQKHVRREMAFVVARQTAPAWRLVVKVRQIQLEFPQFRGMSLG